MISSPFGKKQRAKLAYETEQVEPHLERLRQQALFTRGYSPLLTAILEQLIAWLEQPEAHFEVLKSAGGQEREDEAADAADAADGTPLIRLCNRLFDYLEDTQQLSEIEASLRVASTLHWYLLEDDERVTALKPYYRSVGGTADPAGPAFAPALFTALDGLGELLFQHARDWRIQSNETSRGLTWLLPTALLGVEEVHLVELGANAGLNLYAEQRGYNLRWGSGRALRLGRSQSDQFVVDVRGSDFADLDPAFARGPEVSVRVGGDVYPLDLQTRSNQKRLAACIWGDQPHRLERLREALELHESALAGKEAGGLQPAAKVQSLELPDGLEQFLADAVPRNPSAPVLAFNTYVTAYLNDVGQRSVLRTMSDFAHRWSVQHGLPWIWVRFEPARPGEAEEPHPGWCRWLVEIWEGSKHRHFDLGWAHPHLHAIELGEGVDQLRALGSESPA